MISKWGQDVATLRRDSGVNFAPRAQMVKCVCLKRLLVIMLQKKVTLVLNSSFVRFLNLGGYQTNEKNELCDEPDLIFYE